MASLVSGVELGLISTTLAPFCRAMKGSEAAGSTRAEVPIENVVPMVEGWEHKLSKLLDVTIVPRRIGHLSRPRCGYRQAMEIGVIWAEDMALWEQVLH